MIAPRPLASPKEKNGQKEKGKKRRGRKRGKPGACLGFRVPGRGGWGEAGQERVQRGAFEPIGRQGGAGAGAGVEEKQGS